MRLLITGAGGQLGGELADCARDRDVPAVGLRRAALDIRDRVAVASALELHHPEAVVNCAAWTDVDAAESHAAEAYAVNESAARVLAEECASRNVLLVHLSTDYVFDGESETPIPETATPEPLSVYGASKLAGELAIRSVTPHHQIVRTSGLYGRDGPNFVLKVLRRAASGAELRVVMDQITAPTWTADLAPALLRLIQRGVTGTFHLTSSGTTSWYEFAAAAVADAGYTVAVKPIMTADLETAARRPRHAVLDDHGWRMLGEPPLPPWRAGLRGYIDELRRRSRLVTG